MRRKKVNKDEFLKEFAVAINRDDPITEDMVLKDLSEWDSLGIMCVVTMFEDTYGKSLTFNEISQYKTVKDLMNLAQEQ